MTKKKMVSFLTALCCTASMVSVPAFAECKPVGEFIELEGGGLGLICQNVSYGLLVETGNSEMTLETLVPFGYVDTTDMPNGEIDIHHLYELEEFNNGNYLLGATLTGGEGNNYVIEGKYMTDEELIVLARKLQMELDFVENVQIINYEERSTHVDFHHKYEVKFADSDMDAETFDVSAIPELTEFELGVQIGDAFFLNLDNFDGEYMERYYADTENLTKYEKYEYIVAFAESIQEKYSNVFTSFEPQFVTMAIGEPVIVHTSPWDAAGDNDDDGNVTAEDAAGMLTLAAQIGTGADIKATSANDVNADGTVNAEDAAAVLAYAAANGSGNEVSWVDILRR